MTYPNAKTPVRSYHVTVNPYTWFTMDSLEDSWQSLLRAVKERDLMIEKETLRQEQSEELRKAYAGQGSLMFEYVCLKNCFNICGLAICVFAYESEIFGLQFKFHKLRLLVRHLFSYFYLII